VVAANRMVEADVSAGVIAAINAVTAPFTAHDGQDLNATLTPPPSYVEVVVTSRGGAGRQLRVGEWMGRSRHRVMLRVVSDRLDNARRMRALIEERLASAPVAFGDVSRPLVRDSETPINPDEGAWSGVTTWTLTI
jgi:hypothetical protein